MSALRILVVDDHPIFRLGLCSLLRSRGWGSLRRGVGWAGCRGEVQAVETRPCNSGYLHANLEWRVRRTTDPERQSGPEKYESSLT